MQHELPSWVDRTLYPFQPRTFPSDDGAMSYVDAGPSASEGTILLVHGTPSWSFEFREVIAALARRYRVIAPDHLGFGLSDKPVEAGYTPADHTRRLLALVDALDLTDITLVVHDFGGPIGLPVALDRKDRVKRVIVLNSWMWSNEGDPEVERVDKLVKSALGRFLYLGLNFSPKVILPSVFGDRRRLTAPLHAHYLAPFPRRDDRHGLYAMARALGGANAHYAGLWARRAELERHPLSIVWGMADPAFSSKHLARWREAFPRAEVTEVEGVGHFVAEEAPESVLKAIDPTLSLPARAALPVARSMRWVWATVTLLVAMAALFLFRG